MAKEPPRDPAADEQPAPSPDRTGIEVYCKKHWTGRGAPPKCTITVQGSGDSTTHQLSWEEVVFIPLEPNATYRLRLRRPSDFLSFRARLDFSISSGEVKRYVYEPPMLNFLAGTIKPYEKRRSPIDVRAKRV